MTLPHSRSTSFAILVASALLLVGCISTARTSMPKDESHYARELTHRLGLEVAFLRAEQALQQAYRDQPKAVVTKPPEPHTLLVEPIVTYKTGGAMGEIQHARYRLQVTVAASSVDLEFDLGPDVAGGGWAPKSELPYVYRSFDDVVRVVEEALARP
jgi:hypothetical protein